MNSTETALPLRTLKNLRKVHRKKRSHPEHAMKFHLLDANIKKRQASYFIDQKNEFLNRMMALLGIKKKK